MNPENFITYQRFNFKEKALELGEILNEYNIQYILEDNSPINVDTFAGLSSHNQDFRIKLLKQDFLKVDEILTQLHLNEIYNVEDDYYLFSFSDEELIEIITKRDEWGLFDYLLAQKILKDRGKEINIELVNVLKNNRFKELSQPDDNAKTWLFAGYLFSVVGGLMGIVIGYHLKTYKKALPNGDLMYIFSERVRNHGRNIMVISSVMLAFVTLLKTIE
jgi:hypothetical protein